MDSAEAISFMKYWKSLIKDDNYVLSSWTYDVSATFLDKRNKVFVHIEKSQLRLLGFLQEDK